MAQARTHVITRLRTQAGLSVTALAKGAGMDVASICNIESGRRGVSLRALHLLLEALDASHAQRAEALAELAMSRCAS